MTPPAQKERNEVCFTFLLGGNSVCGMEEKPDSCTDCSELSNCVLDMFYEELHKPIHTGAGCGDAVLDDIAQWIEKHTHRCQSLRIAVVTKYALLDFIKELRDAKTSGKFEQEKGEREQG